MDDGGFLVKFDGKEAFRCHAVSFDYDDYQYIVNGSEEHEMPSFVKKIEIVLES
jgi:hypothetical protein